MRRCIVLAMLFMPSTMYAADWPWWLGPSHNGQTPEVVKPWTGDLKVLWRANIGAGHGAPVIADGKVILTAATSDQVEDAADVKAVNEYVTAFDAATGKVAWVSKMPKKPYQNEFGDGTRATPAIAKGKVFCFGVTGTFAAFELSSGKLLAPPIDMVTEYKAKVPFFGVSASPLYDEYADPKVWLQIGGPNANLVAIDPNTLKPVTMALNDKASYAAASALSTAGGQPQIVVLTAGAVYGVSPTTGKQSWRHPFMDLLSESSATPVATGKYILASSVTLGTVALEQVEVDGKSAVKEAWRNRDLCCYFSTPVAAGPHLYFVTGQIRSPSATLHCVEPATGKVRWSHPKVGKYAATLVSTGDNKLLMLEEFGALVLIQPDGDSYKELARSKVCGNTWAHFAIANGRIYVRDNKELICLAAP